MKNKLITIGLLATSLLVSAFRAEAGQQVLVSGGTNNCLPAGKTYALYGDVTGNFTNGDAVGSTGAVSFIDSSKSRMVTVCAGAVFANPTPTNVVVTCTFAGSQDLTLWTNNVQSFTFSVPANSTNYYYGYFTASPNSASGYYSAYQIRTMSFAPAFANVYGTNAFCKAYVWTGL